MRLFHFSEDPGITTFVPRRPEHRPEVEPFVWVVDEDRTWTYFFPRHCPRILLWPTPDTTPEDLRHWFGGDPDGRIACIEWAWLARMRAVPVYRYELDPANFVPLDGDAWMLVSRHEEKPIDLRPVGDLVVAHAAAAVELRLMPSLVPLFGAWEHSFHFSGIRLRNAVGWPELAPSPPPRVA